MSQQIDEIRVQRLVDGVLGEAERRALLADLDAHAELWREIALAFVEQQIWRDEIPRLRHREPTAGNRVVGAASHRSPGASWMTMLQLAVSLLVVLAIGIGTGQWRSRPQQVASPVAEQVDHEQTRNAQQSTHRIHAQTDREREKRTDSPDSDFRVVLPHEEGQLVEVPVYESADFDMAAWEHGDPVIVEALNERLSRRGYRADWETQYLTGQLADGRQLVLPYRTVSLKYLAQ